MNTTGIKRPLAVTNSTRVLTVPPTSVANNSHYFYRTNEKIMNAISNRFLMWVDAVGGYLVCLNNQLTIGQARPDSKVDIPLLADISSKHAQLKRQGEEGDYIIEPLAQVLVQNKEIYLD